jgi:hypothetical protein
MFDQAANKRTGLGTREIADFGRHQERAAREYAVSGIGFELRFTQGAFLRQQGYSDIPDKFLARDAINLFVTISLGYDVDRDRTGGSSSGPRARDPQSPFDPYYKTFLGLREAGDTTLVHEYAHHFALDTSKRPSGGGNLWADLRNDYWLWRQRRGVAIPEFRACANAPWIVRTSG